MEAFSFALKTASNSYANSNNMVSREGKVGNFHLHMDCTRI